MKGFRTAFAIVSVAALVVLAISPMKDFFREWKSYQYAYNRLLTTLPVRVAPAEIGIKQLWIPKLNRIDRCVTCHLGLTNPALAHAPQPFTTHPRMHHDVEEFGCTVCHGGQGAATEVKASTGRDEFSEEPLLPASFMEASCGKCHKGNEVPQAPVLSHGRDIINEYNCAGCHKIPGAVKQWVPTLDGIGAKVNRDWLVAWLKDPQAYAANARMPNFMLADSDANTLADFLMACTTFADSATFDTTTHAAPAGDAQAKLADEGKTIVGEARCVTCHQIGGRGGRVSIDLGKVASKVSQAWLTAFLKNPKQFQPGITMPRYGFTDHQVAAVVAYIESDLRDFDAQPAPAHTQDPDFFRKGLALFRAYNCGGCHRLDVAGKGEPTAPDLTTIGSKRVYEIDFGQSKIEHTLPTYLATKVATPRVFLPSMKMPRFPFVPDDARAVAVALLANTNETIPESYMIRPPTRPTYLPQGEFGKIVQTYACLGCHTMNGSGRLIATDLSIEGTQARGPWIENYFKVPYSLRPILPERMPNLFMSDAERATAARFITSTFLADSLDRTVSGDAASVARGKGLYFERYGCQACHQIAGQGGYVGPPLDHVAKRLTPGWVFHWLKSPQAYRPGSIEPNNKLTDADADALTAYLMTLQ